MCFDSELIAFFLPNDHLFHCLARFEPVVPSPSHAASVQKIVGRVGMAPGAPTLTSPLSGRPCAFYDVIVEERSNDDEA